MNYEAKLSESFKNGVKKYDLTQHPIANASKFSYVGKAIFMIPMEFIAG